MSLGLALGLPYVLGNGWTPGALGASLLGWWDAERSDLITQSGGTVSAWNDVVAGYSAVQATGSLKPVYSDTSFNSRPGIAFDGVDDYLDLSSLPFPTGASACEMWVLADQSALSGDVTARTAFAYGGGASGVTARRVNRVNSGTSRAQVQVGTGAASTTKTDANVDLTGRHVIRAVVDGSSINVLVDGLANGPNSGVPSTSGGTTRIGSASHALTAYWQGPINSVLVTSLLSASAADQLLAYLKTRGGIV